MGPITATGYIARLFRKVLRMLGIRHSDTPYTRTKVAERFIQTMLRDGPYAIPFPHHTDAPSICPVAGLGTNHHRPQFASHTIAAQVLAEQPDQNPHLNAVDGHRAPPRLPASPECLQSDHLSGRCCHSAVLAKPDERRAVTPPRCRSG